MPFASFTLTFNYNHIGLFAECLVTSHLKKNYQFGKLILIHCVSSSIVRQYWNKCCVFDLMTSPQLDALCKSGFRDMQMASWCQSNVNFSCSFSVDCLFIVYETWNLKWLQQFIFPSIIILVCGQRKQKPNISPAIASLKCVIRFLSIALQKVICIRESRRKFETISISVMSLKWWQNTSMSTLIGTIIPFHNINQVKIFLGMRNSVELQFTKWVEFVFMTIE